MSLSDAQSPIDEIAAHAVQLVLLATRSQAAAMGALIRLAGEEFARLDGEEMASQLHARRSRIHQERASNRLRVGRR
jgi:hypothetical protein